MSEWRTFQHFFNLFITYCFNSDRGSLKSCWKSHLRYYKIHHESSSYIFHFIRFILSTVLLLFVLYLTECLTELFFMLMIKKIIKRTRKMLKNGGHGDDDANDANDNNNNIITLNPSQTRNWTRKRIQIKQGKESPV